MAGSWAAALAATALLVSSPANAQAQSRRWEIVPKADERLEAGRFAVVGGETSEAGVRFIVENLEVTRPVEITLAAPDAGRRLELRVYKDAPEKALLERVTDARGVAVAKFRTADSVQLLVRGPAGAKYQLMTWVGPTIVVRAGPAFVPLDAAGSPLARNVTVPDGPSPARDAGARPATASAVTKAIAILLGLILVALVAILLRLQRARGQAAAGLVLCLLIARQGAGQSAPPDLTPRPVERSDFTKAVNDAFAKLRELAEWAAANGVEAELEEWKVPSGKDDDEEPEKPSLGQLLNDGAGMIEEGAGKAVAATKFLLAFLEHFGLIDPREAAVQPDYNPSGQPLIPSRCAGTGRCGQCFADATARLDKARTLLEDQFVIYKQTELEAGRIHELADAAAGLSSYAQLAWTLAKSNPRDPMNVSQQRFYDLYDGNLTRLLAMLNDGLIGVGACEREQFNDFDWYPRYGIVYYNFMKDRYTRKDG